VRGGKDRDEGEVRERLGHNEKSKPVETLILGKKKDVRRFESKRGTEQKEADLE